MAACRSRSLGYDDTRSFRALYTNGKLPVRIRHSGGPGHRPKGLQWNIDPWRMENETICSWIKKFSPGIPIVDNPCRLIAEVGITELLMGLRIHSLLVPVLPQLVRGLRDGLNSFDHEKKKFCLQTISRIAFMDGIGPQLLPFYRQLLPPLRYVNFSRSRSDRVDYNNRKEIDEKITNCLNNLERTGGPNAYINMKMMLPHYESIKSMIN